MSATHEQVNAIRAFNRFYTRVIGLLEDGIHKSPHSLAEARVLYEVFRLGRTTSARLSRELGMDRGQLSRLVTNLSQAGLIDTSPSQEDGRTIDLILTENGRAAAQALNEMSDSAASNLMRHLSPHQRGALVAAMGTITDLLSERSAAREELRPHRIGELGWLIHRQGLLYHQEQGWNGEFETLIAEIYAEYERERDQSTKRLWVAERDGAIAGSIFVLPNADDKSLAQLRMLYVEPWARGTGLGHRLVAQAVSFARSAGYRAIMLWTQDCLTAARSVYQRAGFQLIREERHHSFGTNLNGQFWEIDFDPAGGPNTP